MNSRSPQKGVGHLVNADSRTRTCDLGFMNPSLWPAELYRRLPAGRGVTQEETEDTNPPGDWKERQADQLVSAIGEPLVELWSVPLVLGRVPGSAGAWKSAWGGAGEGAGLNVWEDAGEGSVPKQAAAGTARRTRGTCRSTSMCSPALLMGCLPPRHP